MNRGPLWGTSTGLDIKKGTAGWMRGNPPERPQITSVLLAAWNRLLLGLVTVPVAIKHNLMLVLHH